MEILYKDSQLWFLISIGIVGEYLGRVFHETKNRPTYLIRQYEQCGERTSVRSK